MPVILPYCYNNARYVFAVPELIAATTMIIKIIAQACLTLLIIALPRGAIAAPGGLLELIRNAYIEQGSQHTVELAKGYGLLMRTENGQLMVPVITNRNVSHAAGFSARLAQASAHIDAESRSYTRVLVPAARLDTFIKLFAEGQLRAPIPVFPASGFGTIESESVALTAANGYQVGNLTGSGIKVAVVDLGFSKLNDAIAAGELPADALDHTFDFTNTSLQSYTKHGTGVAEHVADMAPGAEIHYLKIGDSVDLQNAADYILNNNIQIANHSVVWANASYYDDKGPINAIINDSYDNDGVFWAISSGNQAQKHWRGGWQDSNGNSHLDFSGTDDLMALSGTAGTVSVFLNWNQYGSNKKTDLDLHIQDKDGNTVESSTTPQSRFNNPEESVSFTYNASVAPYSVVVEHAGGSTSNMDITLFSFNHNFEHAVAASSVLDPGSAHGAFTVGAVKQTAWNNTNPAIRGYSSQGPTNDGRQKPDLVAPDGTSSFTYPTANGTSFSSPTTAGAAALLLNENSTLTASDLGNILRAQTIDIGTTGADGVFGYGKLQLPLIDSDSDLLTNVEEIALGTNALSSDTDGDGLNDADEINTYSTDPLMSDTDADGLNDGDEVTLWSTDPTTSNVADLAPVGARDGIINAADYMILLRMISGEMTATAADVTFGDLNYNGSLDVGDAVLMSQVVFGLIPVP